MRVALLCVLLACAATAVSPPTPPLFPLQFSINFTSTVFELDQIGNGTLFYNYVEQPTPQNPSWQVVENALCPTGNTHAPCRYVFIDSGPTEAPAFWVVTSNFCCLAVATGPVIPKVLLSWTFWGTFDVMGVLCDNYYSLEGGVNNLNSFSVAHKDKRFVAMSRAGEGAFNATLLWQFTSGFDLAPPDPSLRALPSFWLAWMATVGLAETTKWWHALDELLFYRRVGGLHMARESQHPDAQWLVSLFPAGEEVTREGMSEWAQLAADQGSRRGIVELGHCYFHGRGCAVDRARALELTRVAAELDCPRAQHSYGHYGFGERDWQRYYWCWRASERRIGVAKSAREIIGFLPSFEKGELGRILQLAVPLIRKSFAYAVPDWPTEQPQVDQLLRVVELHEAMLDRVRQAIACWSMVGQRCGVAQDVRIMITTMLWTEPWRWGAKRTEEQPESPQKKAEDDPAV